MKLGEKLEEFHKTKEVVAVQVKPRRWMQSFKQYTCTSCTHVAALSQTDCSIVGLPQTINVLIDTLSHKWFQHDMQAILIRADKLPVGGCILNCFMLSSLPYVRSCSCSAMSTSFYILNVFLILVMLASVLNNQKFQQKRLPYLSRHINAA